MAEEQESAVEEVEEEEICEEGAPGWVVTFGDMMSLLLTFFILLLSFATMDILRFIELAGTIKQGFGLPVKPQTIVIPKSENMVRIQPKVDFNAKKVMEKLERKLDPMAPTKQTAKMTIEIFQNYKGIVVLFPAEEIFVPGTAKMKPSAKPLLSLVLEQVAEVDADRRRRKGPQDSYDLLVEVKRPEAAVRSAKYDSVWSLTSAQAVEINRYFRKLELMPPGQLIAVGRGPAPATSRPGDELNENASTIEFTLMTRNLRKK